MNFSQKINLLKFKNACIVTVKGKTSSKRGVFIPIEDNHLFVTADDEMKAKGAFADAIVWENRETGKYGDTHCIRLSVPKEVREKMNEEELKAIPFIGNMKPYEQSNAATSVAAPIAEAEPEDNLPF